MWAAAMATLLVAILVIVAWSRPPEEPERRFEINTPARASAFALSPDGLTVTFVASPTVRAACGCVLSMPSPQTLWQGPKERGCRSGRPTGDPSASYRSRAQACEFERWLGADDHHESTAAGASWNRENTILYSASPGAPIRRIPATGGEPVAATRFEAEQRDQPALPSRSAPLSLLRDWPTRHAWHSPRSVGGRVEPPARRCRRPCRLYASERTPAVRPGGKAPRPALRCRPIGVEWEPVGHRRTRHDWDGRHRVRGRAVRVSQAPSDSGQRQLIWVNRKGQELQKVVYADTMPLGPALSHDGRRVAVFRLTDSNVDIWAYAVERRTWDRLTVHAGDDIYPLWSLMTLKSSSARDDRWTCTGRA